MRKVVTDYALRITSVVASPNVGLAILPQPTIIPIFKAGVPSDGSPIRMKMRTRIHTAFDHRFFELSVFFCVHPCAYFQSSPTAGATAPIPMKTPRGQVGAGSQARNA